MDIKTDESLIRALERAARHTPTADEIREQRISFIFGSMKDGSGVTRSRIEDELDKQEGKR